MHIVECLTHSGHGGGQVVAFSIVNKLRDSFPDIRFTILLPSGGIFVEKFRSIGVEVVECGLDRLSLKTAIQSFLILKRLNPDVIHSHGKGAGLYCRSIPRWLVGSRRFHSYHGFHPPKGRFRSLLHFLLERILLGRTDLVVSVSNSERDDLVKNFPNIEQKISIIQNRVDCQKIQADAELSLSESMEKFFQEHKNSFIITMIARDDVMKNYELAFKASDLILTKRKDFAFVFVGVHDSNITYNNIKNKYRSNIIGIPWHDSPACIIKRSHAVLLTSHKEAGLPLVFQEAFCLGKPVIGTRVPGIQDGVTDGVTGLLCEENPDSVAKAIERVGSDSRFYNELHNNVNEFALTLDANEWAVQYYSAYKKLTNRKSNGENPS